jgi:hypothetical protein
MGFQKVYGLFRDCFVFDESSGRRRLDLVSNVGDSSQSLGGEVVDPQVSSAIASAILLAI